jgi:hypothetical protein
MVIGAIAFLIIYACLVSNVLLRGEMAGVVDSSDLSCDLALLCLRALVSGIGMKQDAYEAGIGGTSTNAVIRICLAVLFRRSHYGTDGIDRPKVWSGSWWTFSRLPGDLPGERLSHRKAREGKEKTGRVRRKETWPGCRRCGCGWRRDGQHWTNGFCADFVEVVGSIPHVANVNCRNPRMGRDCGADLDSSKTWIPRCLQTSEMILDTNKC